MPYLSVGRRRPSKEQIRIQVEKPVRSSKSCCPSKFVVSLLVLIVAFLFVRHPKTRALATEFLSPAERLLDEIDRWGNFTLTTKLRSAIIDVINSTRGRINADLPFYSDILSVAETNSTVHRPILLIPGYITGGLEIWSSLPCANAKFRERIWGTANMIKLFISDPKCWIEHMKLSPRYADNSTSIGVHFEDPPGIRIKRTSGLAAADFVLGDYWVWNPIIEALAYVGYDETQMSMMAYDWRISLRDMEVREKLMSNIKLEIEKLYQLNNNERILVVAHSFGAKVWLFFMQWVSYHYSPKWLDQFTYGSYNIAPVFLGVPKAVSALLSGDSRDTAQLGAMSTLLDTILPQSDRISLFSTWGSIADMIPQGGDALWPKPLLTIHNDREVIPLNVSDTISLMMKLQSMTPHALHQNTSTSDLRCPSTNRTSTQCYMDSWINPLLSPLPEAPTTKIWIAYGVGIPTEVGYHYYASGDDKSDNKNYKINTSATDGPSLMTGIVLDDGDGTVPIQSLNYMSTFGWTPGSRLNPHKIEIHNREIKHGESYSVLSRPISVGGSSVDHVDIMGNKIVIRDILRIALGIYTHNDLSDDDHQN